MFKNKLLFLLILVIFLIGCGVVSANENITDVNAIENVHEDVERDDSISLSEEDSQDLQDSSQKPGKVDTHIQ